MSHDPLIRVIAERAELRRKNHILTATVGAIMKRASTVLSLRARYKGGEYDAVYVHPDWLLEGDDDKKAAR